MKCEELKKDLVAGLIIAVISIVMMACNPENGHSETNTLKENQHSVLSHAQEETQIDFVY